MPNLGFFVNRAPEKYITHTSPSVLGEQRRPEGHLQSFSGVFENAVAFILYYLVTVLNSLMAFIF